MSEYDDASTMALVIGIGALLKLIAVFAFVLTLMTIGDPDLIDGLVSLMRSLEP